MMSLVPAAKKPLMGLLMPGTLKTATAPTPSTATSPRAKILLADTRRRRGRWTGGRSRVPAGVAEDRPVVLRRVKFTESLPFVVRQGADVAVKDQALRLVGRIGRGHGHLRTEGTPLEAQQVGRLGGGAGDLGQRLRAPGRRGHDLLERLVFQPHVQLVDPLVDLVVDVGQVHGT